MIKSHIQKIIYEADDFPSLPGTIIKVMQMAYDPDFSMKEIAGNISQDASLTIRILKIVNSAFYGLKRNVNDIHQACSILGIRIIRNVILTLSLINMFPTKNKNEYKFLFQKSLCAGIASELISDVFAPKIRSDAFLSGLLHNIGMFIFVRYLPGQYGKILNEARNRGLSIELIEEEIFGINYFEAGALIAKRWKLPEAIIHSIEYLISRDNNENISENFKNIAKASYLGSLASEIFLGWNKSLKISQLKLEMKKIPNTDENCTDDILSALPELINNSKQVYNLEFESLSSFDSIQHEAALELELLNKKYENTYRELKQLQDLHGKNKTN